MNTHLIISLIFCLPAIGIISNFLFMRGRKKFRGWLIHNLLCVVMVILCVLIFLNINEPVVFYISNWSPPYAISIVFDRFTALMLMFFSIVTMCINFCSLDDKQLPNRLSFNIGFWLLLLGVVGAISTFDIFNLYVWFEVMLVSAFVLISTNSKEDISTVYHYAILNIIGTLLMLLAIGMIYGVVGSLNYVVIAEFLANENKGILTPILILFFLCVGVKAAIFPFYFWLPKTYAQSSFSSTMLLSSLITKVIMLVILRLVWLWPPLQAGFFQNIFIFLACCTMFFGVMGAANAFGFRKILSFHIISQLGYILLAIFIPTIGGMVAAIYFLIHNIFVKTSLLLISGITENKYRETNVNKLGQIIKDCPILAIMFFIAAMSLSGFPPLSGFWAKFLVAKAAIDAKYYISLTILLIVSLFTLYSMLKIWRYAFCEQQTLSTKSTKFKPSRLQLLSLTIVTIIPIVFGVYPDILLTPLQLIALDFTESQYILEGR